MTEFGQFKHGGVQYPLPSLTINPLLLDADPSLYYVLDYFQSVLTTYMGGRLLAEALKSPSINNITVSKPYVVPYDPVPYLQEAQFKFPLLAVYRKKDKYIWKTIGVNDDAGEWCVDYILPPLGPGQMERVAPILRTVGPILLSRIENMFDPSYKGGLEVWKAAGLEEIFLDEAQYGGFQGTGNLVFPSWRGKLMVKEADDFSPQTGGALAAGLDYLGSVGTTIMDSTGSFTVAGLLFVPSTSNFYSGFSMQVSATAMQVPLSVTAPGNVSETEKSGIFFPGTCRLQTTGTFTATYVIEGSTDGANWVDITKQFSDMNTGTQITTITAPSLVYTIVATPPYIHLKCTAYTSGTPAVTLTGIV